MSAPWLSGRRYHAFSVAGRLVVAVDGRPGRVHWQDPESQDGWRRASLPLGMTEREAIERAESGLVDVMA
jgi:hypothetical protein